MRIKIAKLTYRGSIFWLIFWAICFFPVALVLLTTSSSFVLNGDTYKIDYEGSKFWLCFWTLVCFPVAIVLICIHGFCLVMDTQKS